jgi:hypothetical protein
MFKRGIQGFPYYLGVGALDRVAKREDRVCVLNILGGESRQVTPVSHAFSGGNVVFGTSPGRRGQVLPTPAGDIPVYNNVREGLDDGHSFNIGVVYLPPSGVRDGVAELVRINPQLEKIVIITEKISVHDAREIRALGSSHIGATVWAWILDRVTSAAARRGQSRKCCGVGWFSRTPASCCHHRAILGEGWGTPRCLLRQGRPSRRFTHAFNQHSQQGAVLSQAGGYYERPGSNSKPVVACVPAAEVEADASGGMPAPSQLRLGPRTRTLVRGSFGVDQIFTQEWRRQEGRLDCFSPIPRLTAVMKLNNVRPDFAPRGSLALKAWIANDQGVKLPAHLALPTVEALPPYNEQIKAIARQVGAVIPRLNMKDKSGATVMDPKTQVTSVHGHSVLDLAVLPLEANFALPLVHEIASPNDRAMLDIAVAAETNVVGDPALAAAEAAREAGNSPTPSWPPRRRRRSKRVGSPARRD